jgi:Holliday junction resolvasome RuvABC endonuclease subunit
MRVLALDIATNVGWAAGDGTDIGTTCGALTFGGFAHDYGWMSHSFSNWLADQITTWEPELVAIERGFFRGPMSYHLSGMIWDAHRVAYVRGIPRVEYAPLAIKKFIAGTAKASKGDVINAVFQRLGKRVRNDHEADAIALLLLALDRAAEQRSGTIGRGTSAAGSSSSTSNPTSNQTKAVA